MRISDWSSEVCSSDLHVAGTCVRVRFQAQGTAFKARAWLASNPQPSVWHVEGTDTSFAASEQFGTRSITSTGHTNAATVAIRYAHFNLTNRSEERRVGNDCVSKCRYRWTRHHEKKKKKHSH